MCGRGSRVPCWGRTVEMSSLLLLPLLLLLLVLLLGNYIVFLLEHSR